MTVGVPANERIIIKLSVTSKSRSGLTRYLTNLCTIVAHPKCQLAQPGTKIRLEIFGLKLKTFMSQYAMTAHLIVHPKHAKWMNLENEVKLLKTYLTVFLVWMLLSQFPSSVKIYCIFSWPGVRCERANDGWRHFDLQFQILAYIEHWALNISSPARQLAQCHPAHLSWEPGAWNKSFYLRVKL